MTQHYDIVSSLRAMAEARHDDLSLASEAADNIERLRAYIEMLRAALGPFAKLFLFPDDIGDDAAQDLRSDPDWSEVHNDMEADDLFVKRGDIRAARYALRKMP